MRNSSLSVFIFVKSRYSIMSCTQDVSFSLGMNTHRDRLWMSQPRQVLLSSILPSTTSLWSERGSSHF